MVDMQIVPTRPTPGSAGDLEAWIEFRPAFDCRRGVCRSCESGRVADHGRHGVDMTWYLRGPDLAVQFVVSTGWDHPVADRQEGWRLAHHGPIPADIGFHSDRPVYDGQETMTDDCHLLSGVCYYDGSGLNASEGFRLLRSEGDKAVWAWMSDYYRHWYTEREGLSRG